MPGRWIDHATDPLEPWEFDDEDFPEEWKYSKGHFAEVLLQVDKFWNLLCRGGIFSVQVFARQLYFGTRACAQRGRDAQAGSGRQWGHWPDNRSPVFFFTGVMGQAANV